jgi:hypothetical protein
MRVAIQHAVQTLQKLKDEVNSLEGAELKHIGGNGVSTNCYVAQADFDTGITIMGQSSHWETSRRGVDPNDDVKLYCLNKSQNGRIVDGDIQTEEVYFLELDLIVESVKKGAYKVPEELHNSSGVVMCAFS